MLEKFCFSKLYESEAFIWLENLRFSKLCKIEDFAMLEKFYFSKLYESEAFIWLESPLDFLNLYLNEMSHFEKLK